MVYFGQSYFKTRYFSQGFLAGEGGFVEAMLDYILRARRQCRR
jgi:hypothetical protein